MWRVCFLLVALPLVGCSAVETSPLALAADPGIALPVADMAKPLLPDGNLDSIPVRRPGVAIAGDPRVSPTALGVCLEEEIPEISSLEYPPARNGNR